MSGRPILVVDHAPALGGAEISLLTLLEHLDREAIVPHLAAPRGALADAARRGGTAVHPLALARLRHSAAAPWRLLRDASHLARIIRRERIELLQANTMRASVYAALAARMTGTPLLWHVHDIFAPGAYVEAMCRLSALVVAVSAAAAATLPCRAKVVVVHNAIAAESFRAGDAAGRAALRREWGVPPDAFLIVQVARLQPWKGQRDFIAVAGDLLEQLPDAFFAIVGGDIFADAARYERELRALADQRRLGRRLVFAGHREDVPAVLQALDALVHVSEAEPFGRILIEAAAAGLPIAAYASGAVAELLENERTALLVTHGDRAALAGALRRLVRDPALCIRLAENGRRLAEDFAPGNHARAFERAYHRAIDTRA